MRDLCPSILRFQILQYVFRWGDEPIKPVLAPVANLVEYRLILLAVVVKIITDGVTDQTRDLGVGEVDEADQLEMSLLKTTCPFLSSVLNLFVS